MSTGMVLDRSFKLYLDNFALMIGLSAILNVPLLVISLIFNVGAIQPTQISSAMFVAILIGSFLGLLAILIISPLIAGATSMAISEVYLGNPLSSGTILAMSWRKAWTLLINQFIVGLIAAGLLIAVTLVLGLGIGALTLVGLPPVVAMALLVLGLLVAFVGFVPILLPYVLIPPIVMIEGSNNGRRIRRRCWELVKGYRGKVFLVLLVLIVIQVLIQIGVGVVASFGFGLGQGSVAISILEHVISLLVTPMSAIAVTLLYYDFRIRKEGFDLEILSQSIGGPATQA
jgi:hypothetical protein